MYVGLDPAFCLSFWQTARWTLEYMASVYNNNDTDRSLKLQQKIFKVLKANSIW